MKAFKYTHSVFFHFHRNFGIGNKLLSPHSGKKESKSFANINVTISIALCYVLCTSFTFIVQSMANISIDNILMTLGDDLPNYNDKIHFGSNQHKIISFSIVILFIDKTAMKKEQY